MLTPVREVEVGDGVIDCMPTPSGLVIAGDVSGRVTLFGQDLQEKWSTELDMPVWGVAIDEEADIVVVALADKGNLRGAAVVLSAQTGEVKTLVEVPAPTWDAVIDPVDKTAYVSTWGEGIVKLIGGTDEVDRLGVDGQLFGLELGRRDALGGRRILTVTISGGGVLGIDLSEQREPQPLLRSGSACYKHAFSPDGGTLFVGSSTSQVAHARKGKDQVFTTSSGRSVLRDSCAVLCTEDVALLGSLSGEVQASRIARPAMSVGFVEMPASCWSFRAVDSSDTVWAARGDGFLAEYSLSDLTGGSTGQALEALALGPGSLGGARVFISYAHEDSERALELYQYLRSVGCRPWIDKVDLLGGQDWRFEIEAAIQDSDFVLLMLSPRSVSKRGFVQREAKMALDVLAEMPEAEVFLIPVIIEACDIPREVGKRHCLDLSTDEGLVKLCLSIYSGMNSRDEANPVGDLG